MEKTGRMEPVNPEPLESTLLHKPGPHPWPALRARPQRHERRRRTGTSGADTGMGGSPASHRIAAVGRHPRA